MTEQQVYLGKITYKRGPDDFLYVTGLVSDDTLDLDQQRCDPDWLDVEVPKWAKIGNVRLMHTATAVGKATEIEKSGTGWNSTIKVTNAQTATDIEEGVLTGLSVGIKNPIVEKSMLAPKGVITGGSIVEVSLVDRPANPSCSIVMAKMVDGTKDWEGKSVDVNDSNHPDLIATELAATEGLEPGKDDQVLPCHACAGTGKTSEVPGETCARCGGNGEEPIDAVDNDVQHSDATGYDANDNIDRQKAATAECETCDGDGKIRDGNMDCPDCKGTGKVKKFVDSDYWTDSELTAFKGLTTNLEKRDFSDKERKSLAKTGDALPDGSFPIKTVSDLKNAIRAIGRAKDPAKAKAHIKSKAKELGQTALIPDNWKGQFPDDSFLGKLKVACSPLADAIAKAADPGTYVHAPADISAVIGQICDLAIAELNEMKNGEDEIWDVGILMSAISYIAMWANHEANAGETAPPFNQEDDDMSNVFVGFGANPDLLKAASAEGATQEDKDAARADLLKVLGVDDVIAKAEETSSTLQKSVETLEARLNEISEFALPTDVAVRQTQDQRRTATARDTISSKAAQIRAQAEAWTGDAAFKTSLFEEADRLEASARAL
jgi:hypothetical protein